MEKIVMTLCLVGLLTSAHAQSKQTAIISGFVYDAANGEALIGANVFLENTLMGSSANLNGYYVIPKVPVGEYTLVIHYIRLNRSKKLSTS